ncbi:TolC family protein [Candidatus Omnitrophota bacterium]
MLYRYITYRYMRRVQIGISLALFLFCAGSTFAQNQPQQEEKVLSEDEVLRQAEEYAWKQVKKEADAKRTAKEKALQEAREEKERSKEEKEKRKKAEQAVKEQARKEVKQKRVEKKVKKYASISHKYLSKKDYSNARRYAYKAQEISPENSEVAVLITDIDKEEIFGLRQEEEIGREKKLKKAIEKAESKTEDPFYEYDEGKSWAGQIVGIFEKKKYELGKVQEGRTYTIDECVQIALRRSQRMVLADKQVKLAEMRVWETRRDLFPEVTGRYELSTGKITSSGLNRHYRGNKYQIEVNQTVFDGFGSWYEVRQFQTNLDIIKLEQEKVVNEVTEETKKAYYNLDKSVKALDVQKGYKGNVNQLYDIVEDSYEQGIIPRVEYLKVKGQNMQADFQYISSGEDLKLAEIMLFQVLNMEPDQRINIKPVGRPKQTLSIGLENCYLLAFANRPDFKIKEKTIEYYDFERKMMKAKGWPKIDFEGSFGAMKERFEPTNVPNVDNVSDAAGNPNMQGRVMEAEWYAGAKGSFPLWGSTLEYNYVREHWAPTVSSFRGSESATSYFSLKLLDDLAYFSNLQESRVGFENAKYEYLRARKDLAVEVKEAYFKFRKALLQIGVALAQVEHQKMFVHVLEERRRFGEMEASKVIEEYEKLVEHEYGLVHGDASYFISLTELNRVIGVSDYFKPEYENLEYDEWKKNLSENKITETKEEEQGTESPR